MARRGAEDEAVGVGVGIRSDDVVTWQPLAQRSPCGRSAVRLPDFRALAPSRSA